MTSNNERQVLKLLERVCERLKYSKESDWSPLTPDQVRSNIESQMDLISKGVMIDKQKLIMEFLPTSTLQEISMQNDWGDEFLKLATKFDSLIENL